MSSFEQEKNKGEEVVSSAELDSRVYEVSDEESTIFSNPIQHKKVKKTAKSGGAGAKNKIKKIILAAVALVLVVALTVVVVNVIPKNTDDDTTSSSENERIMDEGLFKNVDRITLISEDNHLEFCTVTATVDGKETEQWALADIDPSLTSYSNIDNTVSNFMEQTYSKKISEDKNDGKEYGFNDPKFQVDFFKKGEESVYFSLIIGGYSPTESGRYATTTLDNGVYFIPDTGFYHYKKDKLAFVQAESIPAIAKDSTYSDGNYTEGVLVLCDKMTLSGKNFGDTYKIECKESDRITIFNNYHIYSPTKRPANDENIGNIVSLFSYGVTASGCYSYSTSEDELKKFGLEDPDFEVEIKVGDITDGFKATLQEDGNYAVYYKGNKTIMQVTAAALSPASYTRKDLFNEILFIESITTAASITVESDDEELKFDISTTYDETSKRDTVSSVKINGKAITALNFQNYYSHLISMRAQSYEEAEINGIEPSTIITIKHNNGTADTVIKYYPVKAARYQVVVNGVKMGLISSADHSRIMKYAKNVAADKTYNTR